MLHSCQARRGEPQAELQAERRGSVQAAVRSARASDTAQCIGCTAHLQHWPVLCHAVPPHAAWYPEQRMVSAEVTASQQTARRGREWERTKSAGFICSASTSPTTGRKIVWRVEVLITTHLPAPRS
jgi:hypothetical protein